jgi:hypothetical protein
LPLVAEKARSKERHRMVEEKVRILAEATGLSGDELATYLERTGVRRASTRPGESRSRRRQCGEVVEQPYAQAGRTARRGLVRRGA